MHQRGEILHLLQGFTTSLREDIHQRSYYARSREVEKVLAIKSASKETGVGVLECLFYIHGLIKVDF